MYEPFFGLRKRPYAAAPDAEILVETPAVADSLARLDRCVRQGRGVGVLTAAAGMGKTHLLHCLARRWRSEFRAVLLPNAGFPTRRGLLQSVLAELDQPYQRLGETELRLELTAVARTARTETKGVVLLFDEAHRYSERILEEIRLIANLVENGEPLVRIVLGGHTELEERLSEPALTGLNERVGELVALPRLTGEESRRYLRDRAVFAGGTLAGLFTSDAVEIIVQACGGVPRCLNQLADHALLLGYVAERRPVDESLVREALDDLKRLPLHWHDPLPPVERSPVERSPVERSPRTEPAAERYEPAPASGYDDVIEIGGIGDFEGAGDATAAGDGRRNSSPVSQWSAVTEAGPTPGAKSAGPLWGSPGNTPMPQAETETIRDRYARLDAVDARRRWVDLLEQNAIDHDVSTAAPQPPRRAEARPTPNPLEILDRIEPLVAEALVDETGRPALPPSPAERFIPLSQPATPESFVAESRGGVATAAPPLRMEARHSTLFSELRRRKAGGR